MSDQKVSKKPKKAGYVHGLYAKDLLLPWDDREQFTDLHQGLQAEYFPNGPSEEECVLDLAQLYWLKRTLWRMRTATVLRDPFTAEIVATEKKSWAGIRQGLRDNAREERTLLQTMETAAANAVSKMSRLATKLAKESSPDEAEKVQLTLSAHLELVRVTLLPMLEQVRQLPDAEGAFDKNYLPEALEKVVRLETLIDARITKVLARLIALKEFKRTPAASPLAQLTSSRSFGVPRQTGD
jgi:hypothetical protein